MPVTTVDAPVRSLELFTGAGGLAIGTHLGGFRHVALVEWDPDACETLRANKSGSALPGLDEWWVIEGDVARIKFRTFPDIEMVAGGPPCQPFSIGGKHRGMSDHRDMIPQFIRAVRELRPKAFILENVRGLMRHGFRPYLAYVLLQLTYPTVRRRSDENWTAHLERLERIDTKRRFQGLHYNVLPPRLLNAADYGVPQTRSRVFIVGFRSDMGIEWNYPTTTHDRASLYREQWVTGEYWERHNLQRPSEVHGYNLSLSRRLAREEVEFSPTSSVFDCAVDTEVNNHEKPKSAWRTVRDALAAFPPLPEPTVEAEWAGVLNHRLQVGARAYVGHTGSPLDLPAKTLKAGVHGVPGGENMIAYSDGSVRYFTVREAARLQTFPDTWRFHGAWSENMRQLGNAVPVELARVVAASVATKLKEHRAAGR